MRTKSRIELTDTSQTAIIKMAEGNPGAVIAMIDILAKHDEIDPQAMFGGLGAIMLLDIWGIYGTEIYILFNDKCNRDVRKMLILMRSCQLGFLPQSKLNEMAKDQLREINLSDDEWADIDAKVCDRLESFAKPGMLEESACG